MRKLKENINGKRRCGRCKQIKELNSENFHSEKSRYLGYSYNCRPCEKIRTREKYIKNPRLGRHLNLTIEQKERRIVVAKEYRKTPKGRAIYLLKAYANIDKSKGMFFDLTQSFLMNKIFNSKCVYCGDTNRLGCDRISNFKGHSMDNVVPCCPDCNIARMDNFSHEEMKIIGKAIRKVKDNREYKAKLIEQIYSAA